MQNRSLNKDLNLLKKVQKVGKLGYFIIDLAEQHWEVSEILADMLEFEQQYFEGLTTWLEFIHPDDQEKTMALFNESIKNQSAFNTSYRARQQKSGKYIWLDLDAEVTYFEDGRPKKMIGTAKDISAYKGLIQDLTTTTNYLTEAQKVGRLGTFKVDFMANKWEVSPVLGDCLGTNTLINHDIKTWLEFTHPTDREANQEKFEAVVSKRERKYCHRPYRVINKKSGDIIWLDVSGEITYDANGRPLVLFGTSKDITEVISQQLELERKNKVLRSIAWQQSHGFRSSISRALSIMMEIEDGQPTQEEMKLYLRNLKLSIEELDVHVKEVVTKVNNLENDYKLFSLTDGLTNQSEERDFIHIVDDDPLTLKLHEKLIARINPQSKIKTSTSGEDFLKDVNQSQKGRHLVLLDINMPTMSGWEVLDQLQYNMKLVNTEVVMVSSSADRADQKRASEYPLVLDYIVKPLSFDKIVKLIKP